MNALFQAAKRGDVSQLRSLAKKDPTQINQPDKHSKFTALHVAVANKNEAMIYVLLTETKADPQLRDTKDRRAIDIAMETGSQKAIQMLYEATYAKNHISMRHRSAILQHRNHRSKALNLS